MPTSSDALHREIEAIHAEALRMIYAYYKAERKAQLQDEIWRKWDSRGQHTPSVEWGRVYACERLLPQLQARRHESDVTPSNLRQAARWEADQEFAGRGRED